MILFFLVEVLIVIFSNDVFLSEDDNSQRTPKFNVRRRLLQSEEVSVEVTTPCATANADTPKNVNYCIFHADQFAQNIAKVLDL